MAGYVDIHAHLLPGLDDGPSDFEGALEMARAAVDAGTEILVATPHLRADYPDVRVDELADRCQEMRAALERDGIAIRLVCGAEVSLAWALEATEQELELASYDQRGNDLLIETPAFDAVGVDRLLNQLYGRGLRITLAHPERSVGFQRDYAKLVEITNQGVLLQVDGATLLGHQGVATKRLAWRLCSDGLAHVIASDGHRASSWRPVTVLAPAADTAAMVVGVQRAHWMTHAAPAAIIIGTALPNPPALASRSRTRRLLRRR